MSSPRTRAASALAATLMAAFFTVATPAFAHHGWSDYDADTKLTLKGTIKSSSYENPHAMITLEADNKRYTVILAPVSRMESRGASREAVAVGQQVTVVGYPSKTHAGEVRAERIVIKNVAANAGADAGADKTVELR